MEEKERYEVMSPSLNGYAYIHDFKTDNVLNTYDSCDLLNQQSKRLKELEQENQQLKQSQKQLAISELEKIYNLFEPYENSQKDTILCANNGISFVDYLENQIKSLKGVKNE